MQENQININQFYASTQGLYFTLSSVLLIRLQNSYGYCREQTDVYEKVRMSDHSAAVRA